jgi:hypothetical protein
MKLDGILSQRLVKLPTRMSELAFMRYSQAEAAATRARINKIKLN